MRSMREVALERVGHGETTHDEVERVLGEGEEEPVVGIPSTLVEDEDSTPKVMVVDDDGAVRVVVKALLEREGWRVTDLADGAEAVKRLESDPDFSMIVLDLGLPGLDGREVLRRIRGSVRTSAIPVVVLTGSEDPDAETELLREGADDYVRKPLDPAKFVARAVATLRRSRG
jgi:CheY-like chemotaxis protein